MIIRCDLPKSNMLACYFDHSAGLCVEPYFIFIIPDGLFACNLSVDLQPTL